LINEPIPGIEWEYDFVKQYLSSVKLEEINKLANEWITPDNLVITLNAPDKPGVKIPTPEEVNNLLQNVETASIPPYQQKVLAKSLMDGSKLKPGRVTASKTDAELETTVLKLSNGATVI